MLALGVVVAIVAAAVLGTVVHVLLTGRAGLEHDVRADAEGIGVRDLLRPLLTLVALLLAFVLVQTFSSFQGAEDSASDEAGAVLAEAQAAQLLPRTSARAIVGALRCYARAVAGPGWDALASTRETSPISDAASAEVEAALLGAGRDDSSDPSVISRVTEADRGRVEARRQRLVEARPSVPTAMTALMVVSVAIIVGLSAALSHRQSRLPYSMSVVVATVVVYAGTLVVILDLDRPFGGVAQIEPTELRDVEQRLGALPFTEAPPCDERGAPAS